MKRFTCETRREDAERTGRLLDAADIAFECEAVVMEGLLTDQAVEVYPPAGHTYPKRG
ncbi:hypothetical protein RM704_21960 [Streptomyces sp. DSM 3412]|uniref:Uncharacterized protein n=1 Tax=Streptomyces gottesmaniae TaxID=3075518 RepID=A0ABU2Z376_9ACTN|nr:hypothetical protein [Streptomyces sp. DSM 3412]MDT0570104.1 hypothetical protein [Streptomyces sp. DSM 3412]